MMKCSIASGGIAAGLILMLASCTNPYDPGQRAVGGGLLGAGAGAAIGGAVAGGHGAALGAAIGGATGAVTGAATPATAGLLRLWAGLWLPALGLRATSTGLRLPAASVSLLLSLHGAGQLAGGALIASARRCTNGRCAA